MKSSRVVLSVMALLVGLGIVGVSLFSANQVFFHDGYEVSHKSFYLTGNILPDHIFYPVIMVGDRLKLSAASPSEKVYLQLDYSERRFDSVAQLLDKDNAVIAFSTLTKSQKYLNHAAQAAIDLGFSAKDKELIVRIIEHRKTELEKISERFTSYDQAVLNQLYNESETLRIQLEEVK